MSTCCGAERGEEFGDVSVDVCRQVAELREAKSSVMRVSTGCGAERGEEFGDESVDVRRQVAELREAKSSVMGVSTYVDRLRS